MSSLRTAYRLTLERSCRLAGAAPACCVPPETRSNAVPVAMLAWRKRAANRIETTGTGSERLSPEVTAALQVVSVQLRQTQKESWLPEAHWSSAQGLKGLGPEV